MNKEDHLKKLVSGNRAAFDRRIPDPKVWEAVSRQLPASVTEAQTTGMPAAAGRSELRIRRTGRARIWWVAASVVFLIGSGIYWMMGPGTDAGIVPRTPQETQLLGTMQDTPSPAVDPTVPDAAVPPPAMAGMIKPAGIQSVSEPQSIVDPPVDDLREEPVAGTQLTALLRHEGSATNRLERVLQMAALPELTASQVGSLMETVNHDPNTNVRMAALGVLSERLPADHAATILQEVFVQQDDPSLQLELMLAMAMDDSLQLSPATTERLYAIADDPLALDFVKEHAYAVLMRTW